MQESENNLFSSIAIHFNLKKKIADAHERLKQLSLHAKAVFK